MKNSNTELLSAISQSILAFFTKNVGSKSTSKIYPIHSFVAKSIKEIYPNLNIVSLGFDGTSVNPQYKTEEKIPGSFYAKKVDIGIKDNNDPLAAIGVKFAMNNYSQNANNYIETLLGETVNLQSNGYPYAHIFIVSSKVPYFDKNKEIKKFDSFNFDQVKKYSNLQNYNEETPCVSPILMGIFILNTQDLNINKIKNYEDYKKYCIDKISSNTLQFYPIQKLNSELKSTENLVFNDFDLFLKNFNNILIKNDIIDSNAKRSKK